MIAASISRRERRLDVAAALGVQPTSSLATRAIEGARLLGLPKLERAYRRASKLDAGFKNGQLKEKEEALAGLILDLVEPAN